MIAKIVTSLAFYFFYWFCCFLGTGTDKKNLAGLRFCLDAVQKAVREHPTLSKNAPQERSILSILLGNLLLFTVAFSVLGIARKTILGLNNFATAFWFFLALSEGLDPAELIYAVCGGGSPWVARCMECLWFPFCGRGKCSVPHRCSFTRSAVFRTSPPSTATKTRENSPLPLRATLPASTARSTRKSKSGKGFPFGQQWFVFWWNLRKLGHCDFSWRFV